MRSYYLKLQIETITYNLQYETSGLANVIFSIIAENFSYVLSVVAKSAQRPIARPARVTTVALTRVRVLTKYSFVTTSTTYNDYSPVEHQCSSVEFLLTSRKYDLPRHIIVSNRFICCNIHCS